MLQAGYLRKTPFSAANAVQFRRNAASFLQASKDDRHPPIVRYANAYEAVHALAVGFVYVHGLAPRGGDGHRIKVIGTLLDHAKPELDLDDRSEIEYAARQRNEKIYESPAPPPSVKAVEDLIGSVGRVEAIIHAQWPNWYALKADKA
ncbi:hypothetical protein [Paraburkholderia bryophila]|uniref:HEPN domain-containing protein n=1 Tax=Paraburkholderia bryophila TaxID=420952 RepID=A0A7Y9WHX2_9BURK|nr:hypothetical protein [Paraburkholderia bryophila]NYH20670.1 hypothetical protein [Paraburkholderia bryophila]